MDRHSMTEEIIAKEIANIKREFDEGSAETLYVILVKMLGDLSLREFIDKYNSYNREEV